MEKRVGFISVFVVSILLAYNACALCVNLPHVMLGEVQEDGGSMVEVYKYACSSSREDSEEYIACVRSSGHCTPPFSVMPKDYASLVGENGSCERRGLLNATGYPNGWRIGTKTGLEEAGDMVLQIGGCPTPMTVVVYDKDTGAIKYASVGHPAGVPQNKSVGGIRISVSEKDKLGCEESCECRYSAEFLINGKSIGVLKPGDSFEGEGFTLNYLESSIAEGCWIEDHADHFKYELIFKQPEATTTSTTTSATTTTSTSRTTTSAASLPSSTTASSSTAPSSSTSTTLPGESDRDNTLVLAVLAAAVVLIGAVWVLRRNK